MRLGFSTSFEPNGAGSTRIAAKRIRVGATLTLSPEPSDRKRTNQKGTIKVGTSLSRALCVLVLTALLAGCVGGSGSRSRRPVARPVARTQMPPSLSYRQCVAKLDTLSVRYEAFPNKSEGGGCALIDTVKLLDFGVPSTNLGPMTCPVATNFAAWARYAVMPAARLYLGSEVVRIDTFGTYACRNIVGNPNMAGKRSEHAHGNAIDIAAFVLADGRRVSIERNWNGGGPEAQFLRRVRESACKRFRTVLSPDYNAAHYNHLHFDMGGRGGYCR